jgi:azurin
MQPRGSAFPRVVNSARLLAFVGLVALLVLSPLRAAQVIRIGALPGLRFDVSQFSVKPEAEVEVVFTNSDEMLHNFVVTKVGKRLEVVNAAIALGAGAADRDFVPPMPEVLFATKVVASGQSFSLKFTAPAFLGDYPFVCTMPGHGFTMFGTMRVTLDPTAPVMTPKTPPADAAAMDHSAHQPLTHARVQRFFMPQAGPATIAVELPGGYAFCWDAGACRFRYAWKGSVGERPDKGVAKVNGDVYYREEPAGFPLRTGPDPAVEPKQIAFKGYVLDKDGIPEFEINIDGVTVRERIDIKDGRIARRFRTDAGTIWFAVAPENAERFTATGVKEGAFYKFSGPAAREFTITYTPAP